LKLSGRTALVTGAGRGIGRAIAVRLAAGGAHVTLVARRAPELARVQKEIEATGGVATGEPCDLRDSARIAALTTRLAAARVDILVNVGGAFHRGEWKDAPLDDLDDLYQTNVRGIVQLTQGVLPAMQDGGDIVFKRIDDDGVVFVDLIGACGTCPVSTMTLKAGVERIIMDRVPGITAVEEDQA